MKNQYVGDIGDFGKYSMLRAFSEAGVKIGVNWYLTKDDGSNDGKFTSYLENDDMRRKCPEVFDVLKDIAFDRNKSVKNVQERCIIDNAVYFDELLEIEGTPAERESHRKKWFLKSMDELAGAELIFMDPDNGLLESSEPSKLDAEKYVLPDEVEMYYNAGHNVVYYCHKGRRTYNAWQSYKSLMFDRVSEAKPVVLTYHKGSQRSYIFLIHEESFIKYRKIIDRFLRGWYRIFSEEYTNKGDAAGETLGEAFSITKSDGTVVTIQNRADGQIQVKSSSKPNEILIMNPDSFCRHMGY